MLPLSPRTSTHVFKCSWFYDTECAVEHGLGSNLKNTMKNLKRTFWGKWFWLCRWMIRWKWTVTVAVANVKTGQFWNNFLDDFEIIDSHFATLPRSFEKKRVFMNTVSGPPGCFCRCALRSLKRPKHHLLVISHIKSKWKVWNMFSTNGRFFLEQLQTNFRKHGLIDVCDVSLRMFEFLLCGNFYFRHLQYFGPRTRTTDAMIQCAHSVDWDEPWVFARKRITQIVFLQENISYTSPFFKCAEWFWVIFFWFCKRFLTVIILLILPCNAMQCHAMPQITFIWPLRSCENRYTDGA